VLHKYWGTSALASKLCLLRHFMSVVSCCQVLDGFFEVDQGEAMADIYVWLRYSASRQLTWQRNYNTQPRILSAAQVRGMCGGFCGGICGGICSMKGQTQASCLIGTKLQLSGP
jgi:hypothetical protein